MSSLYGIALQRHEDYRIRAFDHTYKSLLRSGFCDGAKRGSAAPILKLDRRISDRFSLCHSSRQSVLAGVVHAKPRYFSCRLVKVSS